MAKHKKNKDAKRDRRDAGKLPKRIAGVKVPKTLRKGGAVRELAGNPLVRDIVAAALSSAAAVIGGKKGGKGDGKQAQPGAGPIVAAFASAAADVVRQMRGKPDAKAAAAPGPQPAPAADPAQPGHTTH